MYPVAGVAGVRLIPETKTLEGSFHMHQIVTTQSVDMGSFDHVLEMPSLVMGPFCVSDMFRYIPGIRLIRLQLPPCPGPVL